MRNKLLLITLFLYASLPQFSQDIAPYIKVGDKNESIQTISKEIKKTLEANSFQVLGTYTPANNSKLQVIVFTNEALKNTVVKVKDRGALAGVCKVGLKEVNGVTTISYVNPDYILRAYLSDNYNSNQTIYKKFSSDVKKALSSIGNEFSSFGGEIRASKLGKYHYKIMMPYFTDPVTLRKFSSFEEGLEVITKNLGNKVANTKKVYSLIYKSEKVAVFGVALLDSEDGEPKFLPKIGDDHVAAMPYELILQGNKATMLHGKYRIALHWPELSMGTFMRIMSTPGDIEDALEAICK